MFSRFSLRHLCFLLVSKKETVGADGDNQQLVTCHLESALEVFSDCVRTKSTNSDLPLCAAAAVVLRVADGVVVVVSCRIPTDGLADDATPSIPASVTRLRPVEEPCLHPLADSFAESILM